MPTVTRWNIPTRLPAATMWIVTVACIWVVIITDSRPLELAALTGALISFALSKTFPPGPVRVSNAWPPPQLSPWPAPLASSRVG